VQPVLSFGYTSILMSEFDETIFRELHAIAKRRLASQKAGHTLQPTALVNEAWMKLRGHFNMSEPSPAFYKTAAEAMRQILIDHARGKKRLKRGGDAKREDAEMAELAEVAELSNETDTAQILSLNDALSRLEQLDPQAAEVVKLRFFAGLSVEEAAKALQISDRTVKRDWQFARTWLAKELAEQS
jgi:RNA polymerase sigma-70 factor, ECF subfamily